MIVDRSKKYSSYFRAYIDAHQIQDGADVPYHVFAAWIMKQHELFRELKKLRRDAVYSPRQRQEFEKFIGLEAKK